MANAATNIRIFFCTHILRCGLELSNAGFFLLESRLAAIARLGRVFGIHLILATQRPDANLISGLCSMTGQFFRDTCLMKQIFEQ